MQGLLPLIRLQLTELQCRPACAPFDSLRTSPSRLSCVVTQRGTSMLSIRRSADSPLAQPWLQLLIGVICMACVANLQYGWTLFVGPIDAKYHWGRSSIQVAFTVFVLIETWLIPVEGYLVDRFGPRWVVLGGALLIALSRILN